MTPAPSTRALVPVAASTAAARRSAAVVRTEDRRAAAAPVTVLPDQAQFAVLIGRHLVACRYHGVRHAVILVEIELPPRLGNTADARELVLLDEAIGARLRSRVRDSDIVARLGSERFGVILVDAAKADLNAVQTRLRAAVCGHYGIESRLLYVAGRLGAAMSPSGGCTGAELVRTAEAALSSGPAKPP